MRSPQIIAISIFATTTGQIIGSSAAPVRNSPGMATTLLTCLPKTDADSLSSTSARASFASGVDARSFQPKRGFYDIQSGYVYGSSDWKTAGGNAYTGATSDASGGNIINDGGDEVSEIMNTGGSE